MSGNVISIKTNFPEVARALDKLSDDIGNRAMVRAMNKTIDQGKTEMSRGISKEFRITVGEAKKRLDTVRASRNGREYRFQATLEAMKKVKGKGWNLRSFVTSFPRRLKKGGMGQLKFQVKHAGGRKTIPGAFIGNDGRTVFIRQPGTTMASRGKYAGSKHAEQIVGLNTIDVPNMFNTKRINSAVRKVMLTKFKSNFDRELRVVLQGWVK